MDLRDLRYFIAVAETGNTRRAADLVHRSQPAIVKAIERLESVLGAALFERDGRGQRLTSAGNALVLRGKSLLSTADMLHNEIGAMGRGTAGFVRVGAGFFASEQLIPALCGRLLQEAPDVWMQVVVRTAYELQGRLRNNELDVVLGFIPPEHTEFASECLVNDEVVVTARVDHPVLSRSNVSLADLAPYHWVLPNTTVASREWLDRRFEAMGLDAPNVQIETDSNQLVPALITQTGLLGFVSRNEIKRNPVLEEVVTPQLVFQRAFGMTYLREATLSPVTQRLLKLLRLHIPGTFVQKNKRA